MLNKCFLNDLKHLIGSTSNVSEVVQDLSQLIKTEVSVETFINEFLFDELPELVILQGHGRSALDEVIE